LAPTGVPVDVVFLGTPGDPFQEQYSFKASWQSKRRSIWWQCHACAIHFYFKAFNQYIFKMFFNHQLSWFAL